jgi:protein ImuB
MRRVISVWFPTFRTDRLRRIGAAPYGGSLIVSAHDGRRRIVAGASVEAQTLGIRTGMPLTQAQAMVPGLTILDADPEADAAALDRLVVWCLRYAPMVAADAPDGLWIDASGCAHLAGGEETLLVDLQSRLAQAGFSARIGMADTPGCAHAVARYGGRETVIMPAGDISALQMLPVEALRLPDETCDALRRVGIESVGDLTVAPRAPLVRRFGAQLALRLAQASGEQFETIHPISPPDIIERRLAFVEPIGTAEAFIAVLDKLMRFVCRRLERASLGARRLDLLFERVDGSVQAIRIGTSAPSRDARHLTKMLHERLEQVDPGPGVEAMRLIADSAEPLEFAQLDGLPRDDSADMRDLAALIDRLGNRFGADRIYRVAPVESDVPERSVQRVPALTPIKGTWPAHLPRPVRLLTPPQAVTVIAPLPDHPPAVFTWRKHRHRVRRASGPERIFGEWWKREGETLGVRDYFVVEDDDGHRFWLFRRGDGEDAATGDLSWFLHGFF